MSNSRRRMKRLQAKPDATGRGPVRPRTAGAGLASIVAMGLLFAGSAQAATPRVNLGSDASFSVLAGSTVTNTGPTTMFGDLGLDPGSSVTGAPHTLGAMHIDDGVAIQAKSDLVTGYNDAAGRPSTQLSSADLSGQSFTPGVYNASSSLLFSAGTVTLNAQGNPNAVFIFKVGSSMTTSSATTVLLTNGAQPCNVYWQIGASATLGTNSRFIGTVMAQTTITAQTGMTMDGRLLARNGAVNLDTNTITTSACATTPGGTGGTGGTTGGGTGTTGTTGTGGTRGTGGTGTTGTGGSGSTGTGGSGGSGTTGTGGTSGKGGTTQPTPVGSINKTNKKQLAAQRRARHRAAQRRAQILRRQQRAKRLAKQRRLALARAHRQHTRARAPIGSGGFTG